jgi:hypothetical protein
MIRRSLMPDDEYGPRLIGQWTAHEESGQWRNPSLIGEPCGRLRLRNRRQRPVQAGLQSGAHPTTTAKQTPSLPVSMHPFPGDRESRRCPPGAAHANNAWGPAIFRDAATKKTGQARAGSGRGKRWSLLKLAAAFERYRHQSDERFREPGGHVEHFRHPDQRQSDEHFREPGGRKNVAHVARRGSQDASGAPESGRKNASARLSSGPGASPA